LTDPWDIVSAIGSGPFFARVVGSEPPTQTLLLELDPPFQYQSIECRYFVARARHEGVNLSDLNSRTITCNMTLIPEDRARGATPFDLSWWRGGLGVIADLGPFNRS